MMDKFLGIVQNGRFAIVMPREHCCVVRLTRIVRPTSIAEELLASHEINLTELEDKAITVSGFLPEHKGWLYEANVIDQAGHILTEVVKQTLAQGWACKF